MSGIRICTFSSQGRIRIYMKSLSHNYFIVIYTHIDPNLYKKMSIYSFLTMKENIYLQNNFLAL